MPADLGWRSKLGVGIVSPPAFGQIEYKNENLKINQRLDDLSGLRGTISLPDARVRTTQEFVDGSFMCQPVPAELNLLIPFILGGAKVNDATAILPAWPLPEFYVTVDRGSKVFTYNGCKVASAVFEAAVGEPLKVTLNVLGKTETEGNTGTFPAVAPVEDQPYILADLALTIGGNAFQMRTLTLTIDNGLELEWFNSVSPTRINETLQTATWGIELPYGDSFGLYGASVATAVACVATFTNGGKSLTVTSPLVRSPKVSPVVGGVRGEIPHTWQGVARISAANPSIITMRNDSTA